MISHVSLGVNDVRKAEAFYDAVLTTIGAARLMGETGEFACWGTGGVPSFCVNLPMDSSRPAAAGNGSHLGFSAGTDAEVDAFHAAALAAGATDEGAPGLRPQYGPHYYAAFVRDPFAHKIEAVHETRFPTER